MKVSRIAVVVGALALAAGVAAPVAADSSRGSAEPLVQGLAGPLQLDVGTHGQVYVAQSFIGVLTKVRQSGTTKDLTSYPGEIAGVASDGYDVAFTGGDGSETEPTTVTFLKVRKANGTVRTVANLLRYEEKNNPDAGNVYGFRNLSPACAAQVPAAVGGQPYTGVVESHPYALANAPGGGWYVADAAANAILRVSPTGRVSTYFVPRPQKVVVTADVASSAGLPDCTVGEVYAFEPVPTDVEVKSTGALIVSLLPGGPEDPSLGARGSLIRVAGDGEYANLATGFFGATNVAVGRGGRVYVTELFGNRVSVLRDRVITPVADLPSPASVEYADGTLYVATDVFGNGSIVTLDVP